MCTVVQSVCTGPTVVVDAPSFYNTSPNHRLRWSVQLLKKFEAGQAQQGDVEKLLDIADDIGGRSFCALADGAVACLTSAIKHFRDEFEQGMHIPAWELFPYERSALFAVREGAHA